ncbi:MAG TPA: MFS transporter [Actinomycetota bacterium]|nr:MFS transporter [Actinomycetota bacterium]
MKQEVAVARPEGYDRRWWVLAVLCLSLLTIGVDNTILNVALPTLVRSLHASDSQLQWVVDAYVLVFASLLLTTGSLSDRFGRRSALGLGLLIFGIGSVASAFAGSANILTATRAFMGLGGALIMPSTLSILTNVFPAEERGRAIGIWAGVSGLGVAIGPVVGGALLEHFWWGSVFLVNVPVVIIGIVGGRLIVPNSKDPSAPRIDIPGALLSIVGLVTLVYGIIEVPNYGWGSAGILTAFAVAAVVLVSFVLWERRTPQPMLKIEFFRNPRFTAASVSVTLIFFALFGSLFFITQELQFVLGYSPLSAGLRLAPVALVMAISAPTAGRLVEIIGNKAMVFLGMVLCAIGLFVLGTATVHSGYGLIISSLMLLGIGIGFAIAPATESIMGSLPPAKAGIGSAMNDTTRQVGGALGVAILGSVFSSAYTVKLAPALVGAPASVAKAATSSVGAALATAQKLGGAAGQALTVAARSSFVHAMDRALIAGSIIALAGALVALLWLPNRARPEAPVPGAETAGAEGAGTETGETLDPDLELALEGEEVESVGSGD